MKRKTNRIRERGVALITALLMTIIFLVLMGGLLSQMMGEMVDVGAHQNSMKALDAAYAGVENMVLDIEETATGSGKATPAPINYTYPSSTVSYTATVANQWSSGSGIAYYEINATGTEGNSGQERTVKALVRSFPYSYYEQFTAASSGNVYYVTGEKFDGPVYNGGTMNVWYQDPGTPIFDSSVQTVAQPNFYQGGSKAGVAYSSVIWGDVTNSGDASSFTIGTNPMSLPTYKNNLTVASEAFYGDTTHNSNVPAPGANGLYINGHSAMAGPAGKLTSGIFMQGDVIVTPCSGTCGSYSGNNEVWTLQTTGANGIGQNYTVAVDFTAGTTTVTQTSGCVSGCSISYTGVPSGQPPVGAAAANGAIFVDGNVTIDSNNVSCSSANCGIVHGDYTIGVPDYTSNHGNKITLGGGAPGILYKDQSSTSTDELGIWANDIYVTSSTATGYEFDGDILTGYAGECGSPCNDGFFENTKYNGAVQGTFTFHGGLIQNVDGAMGISSGGTLIHGFTRKYVYDSRLAANPPPGFPITNHYDVVAWLDEGT